MLVTGLGNFQCAYYSRGDVIAYNEDWLDENHEYLIALDRPKHLRLTKTLTSDQVRVERSRASLKILLRRGEIASLIM